MALTRKFLKSLGLEEDKIDSIIEAHTETVDGLKKTIAELQPQADQLSEVQKELDKLKGGEDFKAKWEEAKKALADYKAEVASKAQLEKVKAAYRKLLAEAHVTDSAIDSIINATDFSEMKIGDDGTLQELDRLNTEIKGKWGGFITTTQTRGANVQTPPKPTSNGANPRAAEIAKRFHEARYGTTGETTKE